MINPAFEFGNYLPDMVKSSARGHAASGDGNSVGRNYADRSKDQPCGISAVGARRKHTGRKFIYINPAD